LVVHAASIAIADNESMTESPSNHEHALGERLFIAAPTPLEALRAAVLAGARALDGGTSAVGAEASATAGRAPIALERPPRPELVDYSTNAALLLAPRLGCPPRDVAERLGAALQATLGADLERFEVAGPGFLNLFLADSWLIAAVAQALAAGEAFGARGGREPERILVEFVSANPTGPLHVGHARNAVYGDALARVLAFRGNDVAREFYVNDAGSQVRVLGESIAALARGESLPEGGYKGAYLVDVAARLANAASTEPAELGRRAVAIMVESIQSSLAAFGVEAFDRWFFESALHAGDPSPVAHTLAILSEHGHTYTSDGALWLRTSAFGDDKDRVLVRSNGEYTYFASDIAYHQDKRERGFDRQIDVWGADHHGHVLRMKAAYEALGGDPDELDLVIMQLVHLLRSGERAQMSKRAGEFVTLDDLLAEIGVDAARWYLLARSHDTTIDLDLDLAREQSLKNPVYYVQYAHARIVSVLANAGPERVRAAVAGATAATGAAGTPLHAAERALIEQLMAFPDEMGEAAERRAPHRITAYALALAQEFTAFYRDCRVVGAEPEPVESSRIALCVLSRDTIARCLDLLGVSAPEQM
jgi:arginyl-tRNA synthetase